MGPGRRGLPGYSLLECPSALHQWENIPDGHCSTRTTAVSTEALNCSLSLLVNQPLCFLHPILRLIWKATVKVSYSILSILATGNKVLAPIWSCVTNVNMPFIFLAQLYQSGVGPSHFLWMSFSAFVDLSHLTQESTYVQFLSIASCMTIPQNTRGNNVYTASDPLPAVLSANYLENVKCHVISIYYPLTH